VTLQGAIAMGSPRCEPPPQRTQITEGTLMRFMMIRRSDRISESGTLPSKETFAAMDQYADAMAKAGIMVAGEGLKPSADGARISFSKGKPTVFDGPFAETKELIAGYFIIDVESKEEAIEWAKRWPAISIDADVQLEVRPFYEASDFGG
jgi:hypothetical protein